MKFSEMTTAQFAQAICRVCPAIERIVKREAFNSAVKELSVKEGCTVAEIVGRACGRLGPVLFGDALEDTAEIVSAMTGKDVDTVIGQKAMQTMADIRGFIDKDFVDFFKSSAHLEPNP